MKTQNILAILLIAMANYVLADYCPVIPPMSSPPQTSPAIYFSVHPPTSQPTNMVYTPDTPDMSDAPPTSTPSYVPATNPADVISARSYPESTSYTTMSSTTTYIHTQTTRSVDTTGSASVGMEVGWVVWASFIFASFVAAGFGADIFL